MTVICVFGAVAAFAMGMFVVSAIVVASRADDNDRAERISNGDE